MREPFFNIYLLPGIGNNFPNFTDWKLDCLPYIPYGAS
jgi:hypothetical protein